MSAELSNSPDPPESIPKTTFIGLFVANMAAMLGMGILLPILSPFAKRLGASGAIVGIIFAGYALARGIFSPLFGRSSDKYGRKNFMLVGLAMYAILSLGYSWLHSIWVLGILWSFQGIASAMVTPIAQSYIGDITPLGQEGSVMNLFYLGQFGGIAVGPVIGGYLADQYSLDAPFYVMTAAAILGFLLVYFVVPKQPASDQKESEAPSFLKSFRDVWKDRKMKGILYYIVGRGFYRWGFNSFFPIYAVTIASLSKSQVGLIISSYMITGTLLQYPFGRLADRLPKNRAELVALGGGVACITTFLVPLISQMIWLVILVVIMG
ncbi:MAG TPA: MFS transporter, partial [Balneolaceae bacterium]|nr:MFS transporter [Balneolaceae bacterium]